MDTNCQLSGSYPQFTSSILSVNPGSPSPSPSIVSEPLILSPMSSQGFRYPGLQLKSPMIQVLSKTLTDTGSTNDTVLPKRVALVKPAAVTDQCHKCVSGNIHFGNSSITHSAPMLKTTPFHYPFQYPHLESWRQIAYVQSEDHQRQTQQSQIKQNGSPSANRIYHHKNSRTLKVTKQSKQDADLPSSTLLKPATFDCGTAIHRRPANLWPKPLSPDKQGAKISKKKRNKQKILVREKRKWIKRKNKLLHKTELCIHWALTTNCKFKDRCFFAHGIDELKNRIRPTNFKTRPCADCAPKDGRCTYGTRCNYCHPGEAIRRDVGSAYFDRDYFKDLMGTFKDNEYPFGIFI